MYRLMAPVVMVTKIPRISVEMLYDTVSMSLREFGAVTFSISIEMHDDGPGL